jgi:hypothetical protein
LVGCEQYGEYRSPRGCHVVVVLADNGGVELFDPTAAHTKLVTNSARTAGEALADKSSACVAEAQAALMSVP